MNAARQISRRIWLVDGGEDVFVSRAVSDTARAAELEEAVFTSGAIIGSESFVNKVVRMKEGAMQKEGMLTP